MKLSNLLLLCLLNSAFADSWEPPKNPDPQAILTEAHGDVRAKRYEVALEKLVWFHEHALEYRPALSGVRLSFALGYWYDLSREYPPALEKLEETRNQAAQNVIDGKDVVAAFHDMASINNTLEEEKLTKNVFEQLDSDHPKSAQLVFGMAQPALVKAKAYALCIKYIDPRPDFTRMKLLFKQGKKLADDPRFGKRHLDFANKKFNNDVTTLVALLAVNERKPEAEEIATLARAEWDDPTFLKELDTALAGKVPNPWP